MLIIERGREVHAGTEPEGICIQHWLVRAHEMICSAEIAGRSFCRGLIEPGHIMGAGCNGLGCEARDVGCGCGSVVLVVDHVGLGVVFLFWNDVSGDLELLRVSLTKLVVVFLERRRIVGCCDPRTPGAHGRAPRLLLVCWVGLGHADCGRGGLAEAPGLREQLGATFDGRGHGALEAEAGGFGVRWGGDVRGWSSLELGRGDTVGAFPL